jgi:hypothetical protein
VEYRTTYEEKKSPTTMNIIDLSKGVFRRSVMTMKRSPEIIRVVRIVLTTPLYIFVSFFFLIFMELPLHKQPEKYS